MGEHIDWDSMLAKVKLDDDAEEVKLDERDKIKTPFAQIIVGGSTEKPRYRIMWWDTTRKECNIGYSSYLLGNVRKWLEEYFEIVADADVVAVVRCKDCVHFADAYGKDSGKPCGYGQCKSISGVRWIVCADDYCSSGERRSDNATD